MQIDLRGVSFFRISASFRQNLSIAFKGNAASLLSLINVLKTEQQKYHPFIVSSANQKNLFSKKTNKN